MAATPAVLRQKIILSRENCSPSFPRSLAAASATEHCRICLLCTARKRHGVSLRLRSPMGLWWMQRLFLKKSLPGCQTV